MNIIYIYIYIYMQVHIRAVIPNSPILQFTPSKCQQPPNKLKTQYIYICISREPHMHSVKPGRTSVYTGLSWTQFRAPRRCFPRSVILKSNLQMAALRFMHVQYGFGGSGLALPQSCHDRIHTDRNICSFYCFYAVMHRFSVTCMFA